MKKQKNHSENKKYPHLKLSGELKPFHLFTLRTLLAELKVRAFNHAFPNAEGKITARRFDKKHKEKSRIKSIPPYRHVARQITALSHILWEHGI